MSEQAVENQPAASTDRNQDAQQKSAEDGTREAEHVAAEELTWQKGSESPEPNCSICLGKLENRSFTDSCFHTFCFTCLLEWSKVKAVCPLCKQPFKSIIHNVRSIEDYDQYLLRSEDDGNGESPEGHRFRYRTTLTTERWMLRQHRDQSRQLRMLQQPTSMTTRSQWHRMRQHATSDFRRRVYARGLRVQAAEQVTGRPIRLRDVTAEFFRRNPACTHRLVPWLNRELNVLLGNHEDHVVFVLELIMDLIKRYNIVEEAFTTHLESFLGRRTSHFIHEFLNFAQSPYDMCGYDAHAVYRENSNQWQEAVTVDSSTSDSDNADSDVVILSPPLGEMIGSLGLEGDHTYFSLWGMSDNEPTEPPQQNNRSELTPLISRVRDFLSEVDVSTPSVSGWESPLPGPSTLTWSPSRPDSPNVSNDMANQASAVGQEKTTEAEMEYESGSDDVILVGEEKAFQERTPILLSSDEDEVPLKVLQAEREKAKKEKKRKERKHSRTPDRYCRYRNTDKSRSKSREKSRNHSRSRTDHSSSSSRRQRRSRASSKSKLHYSNGSNYMATHSSQDYYRSHYRSRSHSSGRKRSDKYKRSRSPSRDHSRRSDGHHHTHYSSSGRPRAYKSRSRSPVQRSRSPDHRHRSRSPSHRRRSRSSSQYKSRKSHHSYYSSRHDRHRSRSSSVQLIDERPGRRSYHRQQKRQFKRSRKYDTDSSSSSRNSSSSSGSDDIEIINTDSSSERDRHRYKKHSTGHKRSSRTENGRYSYDSNRGGSRHSHERDSQYKKHSSGHKGKRTDTGGSSGRTGTSSNSLPQSHRSSVSQTVRSSNTSQAQKSSTGSTNQESNMSYLNVVIKKEPGTAEIHPKVDSVQKPVGAVDVRCAVNTTAPHILSPADHVDGNLLRNHSNTSDSIVAASNLPATDLNGGEKGKEKGDCPRVSEKNKKDCTASWSGKERQKNTGDPMCSSSSSLKDSANLKTSSQKTCVRTTSSSQKESACSRTSSRKESASSSSSQKETGSSKSSSQKEPGNSKTGSQKKTESSKTSSQKEPGSSKTSSQKATEISKTSLQKESKNSSLKEPGTSKGSSHKELESCKTSTKKEPASPKSSSQKEPASSKTSSQKERGSSTASAKREPASSKTSSQTESASSKTSLQKEPGSSRTSSWKEQGSYKTSSQREATCSKSSIQKESSSSITRVQKEPESFSPSSRKESGSSKNVGVSIEKEHSKTSIHRKSGSSTNRSQKGTGNSNTNSYNVSVSSETSSQKQPENAETVTQKESGNCATTSLEEMRNDKASTQEKREISKSSPQKGKSNRRDTQTEAHKEKVNSNHSPEAEAEKSKRPTQKCPTGPATTANKEQDRSVNSENKLEGSKPNAQKPPSNYQPGAGKESERAKLFALTHSKRKALETMETSPKRKGLVLKEFMTPKTCSKEEPPSQTKPGSLKEREVSNCSSSSRSGAENSICSEQKEAALSRAGLPNNSGAFETRRENRAEDFSIVSTYTVETLRSDAHSSSSSDTQPRTSAHQGPEDPPHDIFPLAEKVRSELLGEGSTPTQANLELEQLLREKLAKKFHSQRAVSGDFMNSDSS